jgi:hypothetical protein
MARFTQSAAFTPSNTDDGSAVRYSATAKAFEDFGNKMLKIHTDNRIKDAQGDAQKADFKNPTLKDNNTIYGNTFDSLVIKGHQASVQSAFSNRIKELAVEFQDDPDKFREMADIRAKEALKNEVLPQIAGESSIYFENQILSAQTILKNKAMQKGLNWAAEAQSKLHDDRVNTVLTSQFEGLPQEMIDTNYDAVLVGLIEDPTISPTEKQLKIEELDKSMVEQKHLGKISRLPLSQQLDYITSLEGNIDGKATVKEWKSFLNSARKEVSNRTAIKNAQTAADNKAYSEHLFNGGSREKPYGMLTSDHRKALNAFDKARTASLNNSKKEFPARKKWLELNKIQSDPSRSKEAAEMNVWHYAEFLTPTELNHALSQQQEIQSGKGTAAEYKPYIDIAILDIFDKPLSSDNESKKISRIEARSALAIMLDDEGKRKGSPLTESEIKAVTNKAGWYKSPEREDTVWGVPFGTTDTKLKDIITEGNALDISLYLKEQNIKVTAENVTAFQAGLEEDAGLIEKLIEQLNETQPPSQQLDKDKVEDQMFIYHKYLHENLREQLNQNK